jgi:hypothetical protein
MNQPTVSLWDLLAAKLAAHPELIQVARENCARWLREGHSGEARLREWDNLLAQAEQGKPGQERLVAMFTSDDKYSTRMRDFHPFAGILTDKERRGTRELCGYRH